MKLLAHCPAQPAQRELEQSSRGDLGSGSRAPAPASEALAASSCDCSRVLRCARERGAFSLVGFCTRRRVVAPWRLLSGSFLALLLFYSSADSFSVSRLSFSSPPLLAFPPSLPPSSLRSWLLLAPPGVWGRGGRVTPS